MSSKEVITPVKEIVVHPLVLLNATDHFTRTTAGDLNRRVVGILLGEVSHGKVDVTNSYAVPFEEDAKDPTTWFLDHNYHEDMFAMFKKVNAREKVVGWYSTGPKIRPSDLAINEKIRRYCANPVLVIINVNPPDDIEIPTTAYIAVENAPEEKSKNRMTFVHLPTEIGAFEAEEVGVEHLLRNIRDQAGGSVADRVQAKLTSLKGLKKRMEEMAKYLDDVVKGNLPPNHQIIYNMQRIFNLSPDLRVKELAKALAVKTNDNMLVIYLSSLVRTIIALHNVIGNKLQNREWEKEAEKPKDEAKEKKDKDDVKEDKESGKDGDSGKEGDKGKDGSSSSSGGAGKKDESGKH